MVLYKKKENSKNFMRFFVRLTAKNSKIASAHPYIDEKQKKIFVSIFAQFSLFHTNSTP